MHLGLSRRAVLAGLIAAPAIGSASAQSSYPDRPVRVFVPFAAGGATDVVARLLAQELSTILGRSFVVENRVGGSGMIGIDAVVRSPADGYTLGIAGVGATAIVPYLDARPLYVPTRDLDFVGRVNSTELVLCARPDLPQGTLAEFLANARANPGQATFGSVGVASPNHIFHEELARRAGAQMEHVPYNGESPIIPHLMTSQLDIAYITPAAVAPFIRDGRMKALAVGGPQRSQALPDVPTVAEAMGWPDYSAFSWTILVAPKGTPREIVTRLNGALNQALEVPVVRERMQRQGLLALGGNVEETETFVAGEVRKFTELVRLNNIRRE